MNKGIGSRFYLKNDSRSCCADRQHAAFDNPAKMACRAGNLPGHGDSRLPISYNPRW
jgi:hypothetical protein